MCDTGIQELAYQATYRVGVKINSQVLIANAWHHRSDALSSVAALVGVIVAYSGWLWADAAAGVVVTLLLSKASARLRISVIYPVRLAQKRNCLLPHFAHLKWVRDDSQYGAAYQRYNTSGCSRRTLGKECASFLRAPVIVRERLC